MVRNREISKKLTVDANVARSAGTISEAPLSTQCRRVLLAIRQHGHCIVMNPDLRSEWLKHSSRFATGWLTAMQTSGQVVFTTEESYLRIRNSIASLSEETQGRNALLKDFHVVSLALRYDKILISNDGALKGHIEAYSAVHPQLEDLIWIFPEDDELVPWLISRADMKLDWFISLR